MKQIKPWLEHLFPVLVFFILVSVYFAPLYTGKSLVQSDNVQFEGTTRELTEFREAGEEIGWTNAEFSGMPITVGSKYNIYRFFNRAFFYSLAPKPIMMMLALFIGFYILGSTFSERKWLNALFSFAFAFSTFNVISLEAGHDNKVVAIALMAPVLAGIIRAYRGELLLGGLITAFFGGFQLYFLHIQITYYLLILALGYAIFICIQTAISSKWPDFIRSSAILVIATVVAIGLNFGKLYSLYEYSNYSNRGGSELSSSNAGSGLDKDYALAWSNGLLEPFTIVFPYFHGGASSGEQISNTAEVYRQLSSRGVDRRTLQSITTSAPLYWGEQPFTAGPIYFGAIICFLSVLSLFNLRNQIKWWALAFIVLSILLSMGKSLEWFTDIFFYYVPLYNKFRSVTMIMSIGQLLVPLLALLILDQLLDKKGWTGDLKKPLFKSFALIVFLGVIFLLFGSVFFDFQGPNDSQYGFPDWLLNALVLDRISLFNQDIFRTLILVGLVFVILWLLSIEKIKNEIALTVLALLVIGDLWLVNRRYLKEDDFQRKTRVTESTFSPSQADIQIKRDTSYYRVLNLTVNPFSDGLTSYHHFSAGGYSAIKMQRYQELIDQYLSQVDQGVLGMLNTKYLIVNGSSGPQVQRNIEALGNAWLIQTLNLVADADEEIEAIGNINLAREAVYDYRFSEVVSKSAYSGHGVLELVNYHPEEMTYRYSSKEDQFGVFSEIYYAPGWNAYIDSEEVDHIRVNYILRGMELPAGNHEIVFKYEPVSVKYGDVFSGFFMLVLIVSGGFLGYNRFKERVKR